MHHYIDLLCAHLPGKLAVGHMPVEVPHFQPLALGTGRELSSAAAMKDSQALLALTGGVQVKGVDRPLVSAELTDEASPAADQAACHVLHAKVYSQGQGVNQLPSV